MSKKSGWSLGEVDAFQQQTEKSQCPQEKWKPTKAARQHKAKDSRWVEVRSDFHEAGSLVHDKKSSWQKSSKETQNREEDLLNSTEEARKQDEKQHNRDNRPRRQPTRVAGDIRRT